MKNTFFGLETNKNIANVNIYKISKNWRLVLSSRVFHQKPKILSFGRILTTPVGHQKKF